jgi:hypothetical protein
MIPAREREFLKLAATWLACRLAAMGGTPTMPQHVPVKDFATLGWALLGCIDYASEMRLLIEELQCKPIST